VLIDMRVAICEFRAERKFDLEEPPPLEAAAGAADAATAEADEGEAAADGAGAAALLPRGCNCPRAGKVPEPMPLPPTPLAWLGDVTEIAGLLRVTGLLMLPALLLPVPLLLSLACSARHLSSSAVCHAMAALACARNQLDKGPEESAVGINKHDDQQQQVRYRRRQELTAYSTRDSLGAIDSCARAND
jgi:hypothetical protein